MNAVPGDRVMCIDAKRAERWLREFAIYVVVKAEAPCGCTKYYELVEIRVKYNAFNKCYHCHKVTGPHNVRVFLKNRFMKIEPDEQFKMEEMRRVNDLAVETL